jgi:hypothetical protein
MSEHGGTALPGGTPRRGAGARWRAGVLRLRLLQVTLVTKVVLANRRFRRRKYVGWIPFGLVVAAVLLVAAGGVTWVTEPYWRGKPHVPTAAPRNIGVVPVTVNPAVVPAAFVSPFMIEIPRLNARASVVDVNTLPDGALDVPLDPKVVGWWDGGAKPGAKTGTAILDGHINYAGVTGVLATIGTLNPGDQIFIDGLNGKHKTRIEFTVTGVRTYNKQALPYKEIFDQKSIGRLAIVTCGGPFDSSTGNYEDNIVAFAVPASPVLITLPGS